MKSTLHLLLWGLFSVTISSAMAQTTILSETFSSSSVPSGWSNTSGRGTNAIWEIEDPTNTSGRQITGGNFSDNYIIIDSDAYGSGNTQKAKLNTPSFDASLYTTITLEYDYQFREYTGNNFSESCQIKIYNGSSWVTLTTYTIGDENYPNVNHISIDITTQADNASNAQVRFYFKGEYDYWFALDNVEITGTSSGGGGGSSPTASTSPGGISNTAVSLWLDANQLTLSDDDKVTDWSDLSSENNDATASTNNAPTYKTNKMNGYPVVDFTASTSDYLTIDNDNSLNPNEISIILVGKYTSSSDSWASFLTKCSTWSWNDGYGITRNSTNSSVLGFINSYSSNYVSSNLTASSDNIISMIYDKSNVKTYYNESLKGSDSYSSNISNTSNDLYLGTSANGNGNGVQNFLDGEIAEVILIPEEISEVDRIILHNYLAAKYGISLGSNDYYTNDNNGSGDFDHNVSGIGKASDGSSVTVAKGTGIITIEAETSLSNNDYLFWGEDEMNSSYTFSTASDYMDRLSSIWRVSSNNTPGSVTVAIDSASLDLSQMQSCATLKLAVSNSSSFQGKDTYDLTYVDGKYVAENISFNNGDYFSYEYQDVIALDQNGFTGGSGTNGAPNTDDGCYKLLVVSNANGNNNISDNANVREIEVESNGEFSVATDKFLEVTGNIVNNGTITIDENASLIQQTSGNNANSGSGTYEITRSGNTNSYIYNIWSSPISAASLNTVFNDANPCDMWAFEKATQSWKSDFTVGYSTTCYGNSVTFTANDVLLGGDGIMDVTRGYFIPGNLSAGRTYSGQANNGDYSTSIVTTTLGNPGGTDWADDDWNLIGNPYPSGLSADSFWQENAVLNQRITDALYFWDEADTNGGYNSTSDYASWNLSGGVESGNSTREPLGNIASGQGFWVVANTTTDVQFNNSMRVTSNDQFFKTEEEDQHNAWFRFTSPSGYKNNILIGYNSMATDGIDEGYDAHKLVGNGHVRFASVIQQDEFVIQSMAPFAVNETKVIPLTVFTDESGIHSFANYKTKLIPSSITIYLRDLVLGTDHDLSTANYTVDLIANTTYDQRFQLVFVSTLDLTDGGNGSKGGTSPVDTTNGPTSILDELTNQDFKFIQEEGLLKINNENGFTGNIRIIDITGKQVYTHSGIENSSSETINLNGIAQGTYFLSIANANEIIYIKQFVNQ